MQWKQAEVYRSVMLLTTSSSGMLPLSCRGFIRPLFTDAVEDDDVIAALPSIYRPIQWIRESCSIPFICIGIQNGLPRSLFSDNSRLDPGNASATSEEQLPPTDSVLELVADSASSCHRNSFWIVSPLAEGICIDDLQERAVPLLIGPVIGKISPSSATILCEMSWSDPAVKYVRIEAVVTDVISAVQIRSTQQVACGKPFTSVIDGLKAGHCYDVQLITRPLSATAFMEVVALISGGFSTPPFIGIQGSSSSEEAIAELRDADNRIVTLDEPIQRFSMVIVGESLPYSLGGGFGGCISIEDRTYMKRCLALTKQLDALVSEPWSSIDLTLHLGSSVDVSLHLTEVLSYLAEAENAVESDCLLLKAHEAYKDAVRMCWGTHSELKSLLSHGSHIFFSSPLVGVLTAFHATSLRQLQRDHLSSFTLKHLLSIASAVRSEYLMTAWCPDISLHSSPPPPIYHLHGGKILVFELNLSNVFHQDDLSNPEANLIDDQFLTLLRSALNNTVAKVLLVISALPLLCGDVAERQYSLSGSEEPQLCYTLSDIRNVLDMIAKWLLVEATRQCTVLTNGHEGGYSCDIQISSLDPSSSVKLPTGVLRQLCCGVLMAPFPDGVSHPYRISTSENLSFSSREFRYTYKYKNPECARPDEPTVLVLGWTFRESEIMSAFEYCDVERLRALESEENSDIICQASRVPPIVSRFENIIHSYFYVESSDLGHEGDNHLQYREHLLPTLKYVRESISGLGARINETFELFTAGLFEFPAGHKVVSCLQNVIAYVIKGATIKSGLLLPTSQVIRCVWRMSVLDAVSGASGSGAYTAFSRDAEAVFLHLLKNNRDVFRRLASRLIEGASLLAKVAWIEGYH
jgi:hypothetical protein